MVSGSAFLSLVSWEQTQVLSSLWRVLVPDHGCALPWRSEHGWLCFQVANAFNILTLVEIPPHTHKLFGSVAHGMVF